MKKLVLFIAFITGMQSISQDVFRLKKEKAEETYENIHVKKISDSAEQTTFMIWIKNSVRMHKTCAPH